MRFAVVPTGNRPEEYASIAKWCKERGVRLITVATTQQATEYADSEYVIYTEVFNIQHWWNLGIDLATAQGATTIAILNDDATLPDDWYDLMEEALQTYSGASGMRYGTSFKISGYAFALRASDGIRADERFVWWYGDDDIEMQCRKAYGFAILGDIQVGNKYANTSKPKMLRQIRKDSQAFTLKWGIR